MRGFTPSSPFLRCSSSFARTGEVHGVRGKALAIALGSAPQATASFVYYPRNSVLSGRFADEKQDGEVVRRFLENEGGDVDVLTGSDVDAIVETSLSREHFECRVETISEVMRQEALTAIDLLKIDVEKAEWDVLLGIEPQDWPRIRQVVVEVHDLGGRLGRVLALLEGHGFECVVEQESMLEGTGIHSI